MMAHIKVVVYESKRLIGPLQWVVTTEKREGDVTDATLEAIRKETKTK
jgi:hypothetical protein